MSRGQGSFFTPCVLKDLSYLNAFIKSVDSRLHIASASPSIELQLLLLASCAKCGVHYKSVECRHSPARIEPSRRNDHLHHLRDFPSSRRQLKCLMSSTHILFPLSSRLALEATRNSNLVSYLSAGPNSMAYRNALKLVDSSCREFPYDRTDKCLPSKGPNSPNGSGNGRGRPSIRGDYRDCFRGQKRNRDGLVSCIHVILLKVKP